MGGAGGYLQIVELPNRLPLLRMIPHDAHSVNAPFPIIFLAWRLKPGLGMLGHNNSSFDRVNPNVSPRGSVSGKAERGKAEGIV